MLRSGFFTSRARSGPRHRVMGLVNESQTRLRRYRHLPCVGACGLRQSRYAFTSHSFSSCPMHREQRGDPKPEPRRAPSSIHRLIMDNKLARRGHPTSRALVRITRLHYQEGNFPVRMSHHTKGAEKAQERSNVPKTARFRRLSRAAALNAIGSSAVKLWKN